MTFLRELPIPDDWRRLWCVLFGHDDIRVIDGLTPWYVARLSDDATELAAQVDSMHYYCRRCKRREKPPPRSKVASR